MTLETNLGKYARPTVDYIFKRVFGTEQNKPCLISFLNSLLPVEIVDLDFENTELTKEAEREKGARLDVLAMLRTGERVNIEVQVGNKGDVDKRSLFYSSRLYGGQEILGKEYSALVPVYSIFILNFEWFAKETGFAHSYVLKNKKSNAVLFSNREMMELHFLEIPKYQETNSVPLSTLEKWMLFFKTQNDKMLEELRMSDKSFDKAVSALEVAQMTPAERRAYEARLAFISDQLSSLEYAKNSGLKEGIEKGIEKGMEKGIEKGMEKGAHMSRLQILTKLASKRFPGLSAETQSKIFMLSDEHLEQQLDLILDYQSKQEFENAIAALPAVAAK